MPDSISPELQIMCSEVWEISGLPPPLYKSLACVACVLLCHAWFAHEFLLRLQWFSAYIIQFKEHVWNSPKSHNIPTCGHTFSAAELNTFYRHFWTCLQVELSYSTRIDPDRAQELNAACKALGFPGGPLKPKHLSFREDLHMYVLYVRPPALRMLTSY